jgi:hypothetical protein
VNKNRIISNARIVSAKNTGQIVFYRILGPAKILCHVLHFIPPEFDSPTTVWLSTFRLILTFLRSVSIYGFGYRNAQAKCNANKPHHGEGRSSVYMTTPRTEAKNQRPEHYIQLSSPHKKLLPCPKLTLPLFNPAASLRTVPPNKLLR